MNRLTALEKHDDATEQASIRRQAARPRSSALPGPPAACSSLPVPSSHWHETARSEEVMPREKRILTHLEQTIIRQWIKDDSPEAIVN